MIIDVKFAESNQEFQADFSESSQEFGVDFGEVQIVGGSAENEVYEGEYDVTPRDELQVLPTKNKIMRADITIQPIPDVEVPTTISKVNLHNTDTDTLNAYISGASVKPYNGWSATDFIPVEDGKYYLAYSISSIDSKYCSKFDAGKGYVSTYSGTINCTNKNRPIFFPGHDGYVRFSGHADQIRKLEFYEIINFNWQVPEE